MCFHIGIEDLAANALIEAFNKEKDFLTYSEIEEYGSMVVQILEEKDAKAVLILSRDHKEAFFRNYSEFFEEKIDGTNRGIGLKANITIDALIEQFRGYLALDVLKAFVNKRSVQVLGV